MIAGLLAARNWFKSLPWEVWAVVGLSIFGIIIRRDARKDERRDIQIKSERTARKVLTDIRRETDDRSTRVQAARDRVPDGPMADELSDDTADLLFGVGRDGDSGGGGGAQ